MNKDYRTCHHAYDNGNLCQSAAVTGRDYCVYHLRHRGLRMRMAQARARSERFQLNLPPLENMHAVQSALTQLMEAVAADMIDLKRAQFMLSLLRQAAKQFQKARSLARQRVPERCFRALRRRLPRVRIRVRTAQRPRPRHPTRSRLPPARHRWPSIARCW